MKTAAAILATLLAGCGTNSSYMREHELTANLPRAQGIGAFSPQCIFICITEAHFTHGDDTIDPNATEALMHSKLQIEQYHQSGSQTPAMVQKRLKPKTPPPPKGATP